jgi:hypothetical protein
VNGGRRENLLTPPGSTPDCPASTKLLYRLLSPAPLSGYKVIRINRREESECVYRKLLVSITLVQPPTVHLKLKVLQ